MRAIASARDFPPPTKMLKLVSCQQLSKAVCCSPPQFIDGATSGRYWVAPLSRFLGGATEPALNRVAPTFSRAPSLAASLK